MSTLLDRLAEQLAVDAVEQAKLANDPGLIDAVAKSLADTSTTFKEAFLTCVRYIQAEERARDILPNLKPKAEGLHLPPPPDAETEATTTAARPVPAPGPKSGHAPDPEPEDDGYAEVEYLDDKPAVARPSFGPAARPANGGSSAEAETPAAEPEITGPRKRGH